MVFNSTHTITFERDEAFDVDYIKNFCKSNPTARALIQLEHTKGISSTMIRQLDNSVAIKISGGYDKERVERNKNKTFNKSLNNSTSYGTFHNIFYTSSTGTSPIEELNFDNIIVNSTNTYFGEINNMSYSRAYSSKGIHFLGRNMKLNNVTNFNFLNIGDMIEVDLSESYMPKVHTLSISSTSAYSNAVKRLRTIKLNGITMPNLATLSSAFSGNKQLQTIEMEGFGTTKVTNMSSAFADCEALSSLDLSS